MTNFLINHIIMNWIIPRHELVPQSSNFKKFGHTEKIPKSIRNIILSQNNYTCRYCGGIYPKYLICININNENFIDLKDVCCRICYIITHLNYGLFREIKLYCSELTQLEIIRKSVDFILENGQIPSPKIIDNNIKIAPISLIEFIILLNNSKTFVEFNKYKLFFSNKLNIDFIVNNYLHTMSLFINETNEIDNIIDSDKINNDDDLDFYIPSNQEKKIFQEILNPSNQN